MKKKLIYFIIFTLGSMSSWGQISIIIDSINFDNVIEARDKELYISHWGNGPVANMSISIINFSRSEIKLNKHSDYQLYCIYEYNGNSHKSIALFLSIGEDHPLVLQPDSTYNEILTTSLYLPHNTIELTDVIVCDHALVLNEVISSFKVVLSIDGKEYVSNIPTVITRGAHFYREQKWDDD